MSNKNLLINVSEDESRIAIVEDNLLQELLIEHASREQIKGNIYKGVVVQFQSAVQAAFVDFGGRRHGFLPMAEVNPNNVTAAKGQRKGHVKLKVGQEVLVQVTREEVDKKGAALTTYISLAGRYMVMMPQTDKGGVSKKIQDPEERERLKTFLTGIESEEHACIIRTAGVGRDLNELKKDYTRIKRHWNHIQDEYEDTNRPGLISLEQDVITRTLRDYYQEDITELWVDNPDAFQTTLEFLKENYPRRQKDLKLFVDDRSLFASYNIEKQVEQLTSRSVKLRSGGSIAIDQTEAMVAIDVNSGRSNRDRSIDDTAFRTNMEAAEEVARQLRLRNLGGLIVVDFIDMESDSSRRKVEDAIANAMSRDKAQHKILPISQFGLLEISRQRMAQRISSVVETVCPTCRGKGQVPSKMATINLIIRSIRDLAARGNVQRIQGDLPIELANQLLNEKRQSIMDLEQEFGIEILLQGNPEIQVFDDKKLRSISHPSSRYQKPEDEVEELEDELRNERPERSRGRGRDREQSEERPSRGRGRDRDDSEERPSRGRGRGRTEESEETETAEATEARGRGRDRDESEERPSRGRGRGRGRGRNRDEVEVDSTSEATSEESSETGRPERPERSERPRRERKPREERAARESRPQVDRSDSAMHKGCLFPDSGEDIPDAIAEAAKSGFYSRLTGKIGGEAPYQIPAEFLWRTQLPSSTAEAKPKKAKPAAKKAAPKKKADSAKEEAKAEKPKRGRPAKAAKAPEAVTEEVKAEKPKRGRPKKAVETTESAAAKPKRGRPKKVAAAATDEAATEKPKRGRPKKVAPKE